MPVTTVADLGIPRNDRVPHSSTNRIVSARRRQIISLWIAKFGASCHDCGVTMRPGAKIGGEPTKPAPDAPTIEHIVDMVAGGTNAPENLRVICYSCNNSKAVREHTERQRAKAEEG